jgi:hypothetical protein
LKHEAPLTLFSFPFLTGYGPIYNDSAPTRAHHKPWSRVEKVIYVCVAGLVGTAYTMYIGAILVFWFKAQLAEVPFLTGGGPFYNDSAPPRAHKPSLDSSQESHLRLRRRSRGNSLHCVRRLYPRVLVQGQDCGGEGQEGRSSHSRTQHRLLEGKTAEDMGTQGI